MLFEKPSSIMSEFHQPNLLTSGAYGQSYSGSFGQNQNRFSSGVQGQAHGGHHQQGNSVMGLSQSQPGTPRVAKPNEVFVGNLSYFCTETDLYELFSQYVPVEDVRIVRNDSGRRSLMFGFIIFPSPFEAVEAVKILNNHLFMGRNLK